MRTGSKAESSRPLRSYILRGKKAICLEGERPARGRELFRPVRLVENCRIVVEDGLVVEVGSGNRHYDFKNIVVDAGDVIIAPPLVNCHSHLQLSWLKGRLRFGQGFTEWLKSMVPLLLERKGQGLTEAAAAERASVENAFAELVSYGTIFIGDVGSSLPGAPGFIEDLMLKTGVGVRHFAEWFGFGGNFRLPWPAVCRVELEKLEKRGARLAPAGHALYSTAPELLRAIRRWCGEHGRIFSFHLAESPEESELLLSGNGPLYEFYSEIVLPPDWQAPKKGPVEFARELGLLGPDCLAVHCVQVNDRELDMLAESGCAVCLCPRSNANIGVGEAPVRKMIDKGLRLCLGTDGLSSNTDLDLRKEAEHLIKKLDLPPAALLRMLTLNGADCLGYETGYVTMGENSPGRFSYLSEDVWCF